MRDLVEGIVGVLTCDDSMPFNLGNPAELSMRQLAETMCAMAGMDLEITYMPLPVDDPKRRQPDITRVKTELGWEPKISIEEGMKETFEFYRTLMAKKN